MLLRRKIQISLAALLALLGTSSGYLVHASRNIHAFNLLLLDDAPSVDAAEALELDLQRLRTLSGFGSAPATPDPSRENRPLRNAFASLNEIESRARSSDEHRVLAELRLQMALLDPGAIDRATLDGAIADAERLTAVNRSEMAATTAASARLSREAEIAAAVLAAAGLLVTALVFGTLWRSISVPLGRIFSTVARIEAGDATVRVGASRDDELGRLARALDAMLDAAERRESDKADFIAGVAHDLRTPMSTISIGVSGLARSLTDPKALERADMIARQVSRLDRMLAELLDVARIAARTTAPRNEPVALHALAEDVAALFRDVASKHSLTLTIEPAFVRGDPDLLMRVLVNLLSNAVKYSPGGGAIEVAVRVLDREAEVSVRDEGIGIAPAEHEKVFQRFARVDHGSEIEGTGLGLYLARRIVAQQGGVLDFESTPGQGTRFFARLPRIVAPAVAPPGDASEMLH